MDTFKELKHTMEIINRLRAELDNLNKEIERAAALLTERIKTAQCTIYAVHSPILHQQPNLIDLI